MSLTEYEINIVHNYIEKKHPYSGNTLTMLCQAAILSEFGEEEIFIFSTDKQTISFLKEKFINIAQKLDYELIYINSNTIKIDKTIYKFEPIDNDKSLRGYANPYCILDNRIDRKTADNIKLFNADIYFNDEYII